MTYYLFPVSDWEYLPGGSASNARIQAILPDFVLIVEAELILDKLSENRE